MGICGALGAGLLASPRLRRRAVGAVRGFADPGEPAGEDSGCEHRREGSEEVSARFFYVWETPKGAAALDPSEQTALGEGSWCSWWRKEHSSQDKNES